MYRFYLSKKIEDPQQIIINNKEIIKKITKVLRKSVGDTFILFDDQAEEYEVKLTEIKKDQIICQAISRNFIDRELALEINLYQSLLKKDKFELVLQKATEIGVKKIIPIISENCIVKDLSKTKISRYEKILTEATMQSGGKITPELNQVLDFEKAIAELNTEDFNLIAHEREQDNKLINILQNNNFKKINLFIGPEGGFSEQEINLAQRYSVLSFSLGKRILRAETAALVACGTISQIFIN
ncbi:MAG: RsmE family RNA methyltransferase [Candidatus Buchananbacteria bacterium]|nr:RsmE family RNA methyltransferase [Candidatus Buchananbacteria bacterium]